MQGPATSLSYFRLAAADLRGFLLLTAQLCLLTFFVCVFGIEEQQGFFNLLLIAVPAFVIHSFLPPERRPVFLTLVFAGTCLWAFGWVSGGFILFVSLLLFILADLPLRFWLKLLLVLGVAGGLFALRTQFFFAPRAIIATPYIASLFMFRLISYFQFQKKKETPAPFFQRLNYFLLLPNLTFLLFPIIDYRFYIRTYYTRPALEIYRKGLYRLSTGILLLMLYRLVYYYFSVPAEEVHDLESFAAYISVTYILVIRIAGMLQICVGIVTLFGHDLPPAFENFFLSTGFSDLWRRINIYWRDFVIKTFYFPLYFKLRKAGPYFAILIAGLTGFFFSWMLHSYQLFWITGNFSFQLNDCIYWMTMGVFITIDGMVQFSRSGKKNSRDRSPFVSILFSGLRITGIFIYASILWSIWNSESLHSWMFVVHKALKGNGITLPLVLFLLGFVFFTGTLSYFSKSKKLGVDPLVRQRKFSSLASFLVVGFLLFMAGAKYLPADARISVIAEEIGKTRVNNEDRDLVDEGYYGQLLTSGGMLSSKEKGFQLLGDMRWGAADGAMHRTGDIYLRVFNPNVRVKHYNFHLNTNSFGMRDQEYTLEKPANTLRWIFLGGSYVTGFGVEMENNFEELLEKKLNDSLSRAGGKKLEILNYSGFGYGLCQDVALCRDKVFRFQPDAVFYFAHPDEPRYCAQMLSKFSILKTDLRGYPELQEILAKSGVKQTQARVEMIDRLRPYSNAVITWGYKSIVENCRLHGAQAVWVFFPTTTDKNVKARYDQLSKMAADAGFICLDLSDVFEGQKLSNIQGGGIDTHPSAYGHQLVKKKLEREIRKHPELLNR